MLGNTALTYACAGGFVDIVKVLLNEGANIEDHNENGHTPFKPAIPFEGVYAADLISHTSLTTCIQGYPLSQDTAEYSFSRSSMNYGTPTPQNGQTQGAQPVFCDNVAG